jgi:hypothetical protein
MPEPVREWPPALEHVLSEIRPISGLTGCYLADADLSKDEVLLLNLFEVGARLGRISFKDPATSKQFSAYMNVPVGIGPPREAKAGAVRMRIALTDVHPH